MIDSIKIILKNFSGNFDNCRLRPSRKVFKHPDEKEYENYLLPNHTRFDRHSMKVHRALKTGTVNVVGSLRKRAYHKSTLLDLNKDKFVQSLRGLAKDLNIPFAELTQARFTDCEIGANINIRYPAKEVLYMIVVYSKLKRNDDRIEDGTLYFEGADKDLKLYVKDDEIAAKSSPKKQESRKRAFARLKECGNHMLRLEFTLKYQRSFNHHGMAHIKTVGDLIEHYDDLYAFWTREVARLIFFNQLDYSSFKLNDKEVYITHGLEQYGFEWFVEEYQKLCEVNAKTSNSIKTVRSEAYRTICKVLDQYYDRKAYNMYNLRADIAKYLIRNSKSEDMDLPLLLRNLWGVSPCNNK